MTFLRARRYMDYGGITIDYSVFRKVYTPLLSYWLIKSDLYVQERRVKNEIFAA